MRLKILFVDKDNVDDPRLSKDNVIAIPKVFEANWNDRRPYQIWKGSRFSAKSWTKAKQFLLRGNEDRYFRLMFARHTQKAARDSQFQLFKDIITKHDPIFSEIYSVHETSMTIEHKENGNMIKGGSFEQPDSLMSFPDLTDFWAEEPITRTHSIDRQAVLDISGTLRNPYGVAPVFHYTFNPINKTNFIYEDYFSEDAVYDSSDFSVVTANYWDNPFCPQDRIDFLDKMRISDPSRYRVDGKGEWGSIKTGQEWAYNFNDGHIHELEYDRSRSIHASFDQNYKPYATELLIQIQKDSDFWNVDVFDEICLPPPRNSSQEVCQEHDTRGYEVPILYGDASGRNQSQKADARASRDHYTAIKDHWSGLPEDRVCRRNPPRHLRRGVINRLLSGYYGFKLRIDPRCVNLIKDFETLQTDKDGNYVKKRVKDKVSGDNYEEGGHCMDAFIYFLYECFPEAFEV